MRVNSNAMSDFSNEYEGLKSKIYNIDSPEALKVWNKDFQSLTTSVKAAGKTGLSAIDSLTAGMKKFFYMDFCIWRSYAVNQSAKRGF